MFELKYHCHIWLCHINAGCEEPELASASCRCCSWQVREPKGSAVEGHERWWTVCRKWHFRLCVCPYEWFHRGQQDLWGSVGNGKSCSEMLIFEAKHLSVIVFPHVSAGLVNSSFSNTLCNYGLPMLSLTCSRSWHESSFYGRDGFFWAIWWWFECGNFIKMNGVTHSFVALVWYSHQCIVCALTDGIVIQTEIWRSIRFTLYTRIKMSGECLKGNINIIFLLT